MDQHPPGPPHSRTTPRPEQNPAWKPQESPPAPPPSGTTDVSGVFEPAVAAGGSGAMAAWKMFGASFENLIRSCRTKAAHVDPIAFRLWDTWQRRPDLKVEVTPTGLMVDDHLAQAASSDEGRWMLPAFMAGLRSLHMTEDATQDDVLRLAGELSALEPSLAAIGRFRDWLWADGAEGFEIRLDQSFAEGMDYAMLDERTQARALAAVRTEAAVALQDRTVRIEDRDLDRAGARPEFQVPLDRLLEGVASGLFRFDEADRAALAAVAEDPVAWVDAQIRLALDHPAVQERLPPRDLARRINSIVNREVDVRFLQLLADAAGRTEPYARNLTLALDSSQLGETLGRRITLTEEARDALTRLLAGKDSPLRKGIATSLLRRGAANAVDAAAVAEVVRTTGLDTFAIRVDVPRLDEGAARLLGSTFGPCNGTSQLAGTMLDGMSPRVAAAFCGAVPPRLLLLHADRIARIIEAVPAESVHEIVKHLAGDREPAWARKLCEMLGGTAGKAWGQITVRLVCRNAVELGLAEGCVLPLAASSRTWPAVRTIALDALRADPAVLKRATRWQVSDLLESPELREQKRELRRLLEGR